jgi:hypothetical protein
MTMLNELSKSHPCTLDCLSNEQLAAIGGGFGWAVVVGVSLYIGALNQAWTLGERIGNHFWGS